MRGNGGREVIGQGVSESRHFRSLVLGGTWLLLLLLNITYILFGVIPYYGSQAHLHYTKARWEAPFYENIWGNTLMGFGFWSAFLLRLCFIPIIVIAMLYLLEVARRRVTLRHAMWVCLFLLTSVLGISEVFVSRIWIWFLD